MVKVMPSCHRRELHNVGRRDEAFVRYYTWKAFQNLNLQVFKVRYVRYGEPALSQRIKSEPMATCTYSIAATAESPAHAG
jgi:hypothetical protein